MYKDLTILILDDEHQIREEIEEFLVEKRCKVFQAGSPSEAFDILSTEVVDICILDIRLPEMNGMQVLELMKRDYPLTEVIMISGHGDMEIVIKSMRSGAIDFLNKPFSFKDLERTLTKIKNFHYQHVKNRIDVEKSIIDNGLEQKIGHMLIGESKQMKELFDFTFNIAMANYSNVLITGESGTGKELIAKLIHYLSPRKNHQFYPVNCSAIPDELVESEFFGHMKGAFTGAIKDKAGWFEIAHKSTLFMDEIGDMKITSQPKFLRVLDTMNLIRVGSTKNIKIDVRLIAATNQDLEELVRKRLFRSDLYYRLNALTIHIPPLRERKEDIAPLFRHFLTDYSQSINKTITDVDPNVMEWLYNYNFPGNIRELKHMVERAIILCNDQTIRLQHFISTGNSSGKPRSSGGTIPPMTLKELEKQTIVNTLKKARFVKVQTAKLLNISRQALDRKIEKYGIEVTWK